MKTSSKNNFGEIPATWQMSEKISNLDSEGRLLDKKIAENFLDKFNSKSKNFGKIISVEEKNKIESQRLPYSLSTLQIESGKNLEEVVNGKENFDKFYKNQVCDLTTLLEKAKKVEIISSRSAIF